VSCEVVVKLFATFREGRGKQVVLPLVPGTTTPSDLVRAIGLLEVDVAILLVNGRDGKWDQRLEIGDYLSIFPPVGGG